ncbi:MAG: hypothetical protein V4654_13660 [Bdellovibrionota bacterium]
MRIDIRWLTALIVFVSLNAYALTFKVIGKNSDIEKAGEWVSQCVPHGKENL